MVGTIYRFCPYIVIITKYGKTQNHRDMFFIPKNIKIKSQSLLIIEKRAKYLLGASDKYFMYDFFQFIMNILVIVFKIEILIYNTQMNSTLRQFMSTGVH